MRKEIIEKNSNEMVSDWNICKYGYEGCKEAKDSKYFNMYCINNGQGCPIKPLELLI